MANIYGRQKKFDKAFVLLESTLNTRIELLGIDHLKVGQALFSLGILFDKTRDFKSAMNSFSNCLDIQQKVLGTNSLEYAETLAAIGQCLGNQGNFVGALEIWREVMSIYSNHGFDSNNSKIIALEKQLDLAMQLSNKAETKWGSIMPG